MDKEQLFAMMETYANPADDEYCVIDPTTREINISEPYKIIGVESDERVERIRFQCPKIVGDNIDLSELSIRINYRNANKEEDQNLAENIRVEGDNVFFDWILTRKVAKYKGVVQFIVCAVKTFSDTIINEWNTTLAESNVLEGLEVEPTPEEEEQARDLLAELLAEITLSKNSAVQEIQSEKTKALTEIDTKKTASLQEIKNKTDESLASIPEDYKTLSDGVEKLQAEIQTVAPGIVCTTTGEQISIDNASDLKFRGLKVYGKGEQVKTNGYQLFDASKIQTKTQGGATVTNNDDGSFIVSGSGTLNENFLVYGNLQNNEKKIFKANLPIKGLRDSGETNTLPYFRMAIMNNGLFDHEINNNGVMTEEEINNDNITIQFRFYGGSGREIIPGTVKPMVYQDGDGTWEPYTGGQPAPSPEYPQEIHMPGESGSMNVNVTGNQLFDASEVPTKTYLNVTVTNNGDGSLTVSGSGNIQTSYNLTITYEKNIFKPNIPIKGLRENSADKKTIPYFRMVLMDSGSFLKELFDGDSISESEFENDNIKVEFRFSANGGETIVPGTIKPMIYQDGNGTWEPFKQPQTLPITTPNGLPGIPVTSGGNYTDQKGQQWISDVKDYETGKYTQMVKEVVFDGSDDEKFSILQTAEGENILFNFGGFVFDVENYTKRYFCNRSLPNSTTSMALVEGSYIHNKSFRFSINKDMLSSADVNGFKLWLQSNPITVLYPLATPIVTDIPAEEMAAYNAMHSNYPNTNVFSDRDVEPGMEVKYTADTKIYVDNKIAEAVTQAITIAKA